jgi:hypothetical protein
MIPRTQAPPSKLLTSKSWDHEEEHLHGPIARPVAADCISGTLASISGRKTAGPSPPIRAPALCIPLWTASLSIARFSRTSRVEQSWKQPRTTAPTAVDRRAVVIDQCGKRLRFPAFVRRDCSIDLSFSFARGAPDTRPLDTRRPDLFSPVSSHCRVGTRNPDVFQPFPSPIATLTFRASRKRAPLGAVGVRSLPPFDSSTLGPLRSRLR